MNKLFAVLATILFACTTPAFAQDTPVDPEPTFDISGTWFDAENPGWGLVVDAATEGTFLSLFTYNLPGDPAGQAWYVGFEPAAEVAPEGPFAATYYLNRPSGEFPATGWAEAHPTLSLKIEELDANNIFVVWTFNGEGVCVSPRVSPTPWFCGGAVTFTRLLTPKE